MVSRRIFGPNRDKMTGALVLVVRVFITGCYGWGMGEMRNMNKILVGICEGEIKL
jgi:hypothetical protein